MENHPIDQLFKEKLGNFEQVPPVDLLDKIHQEVIFRSRVRRLNQVKAVIGIAAALVLIMLAGWYTSSLNQYAGNKISAISQENNTSEQTSPAISTPVTAKSEHPLMAYQQSQSQIKAKQNNGTTKIFQGQKKITPVPSGNEPMAIAPVNEESTKGTTTTKPSSVSKETAKTESVQKNSQKRKEPLYFADSQFGTNVPQKNPVKGSWVIKAELSPMFAPQNQSGSSSGSANTKSINTLSGGMIASYKLSKRISISSGVRFSQMKQGTHTDYSISSTSGIMYLQPVEKSANISRDVSLYLPSLSSIVYSNGMKSSSSNIFASDISQEFKYIEIPLQATYKLIDDKLSLGLTGGIGTNILVGNLASITENGIKLSQGDTNNLRNIIYSGTAGLEVGYVIGKNLILTVEPRVKQYMHSVSTNDLVDYKPLQLGIFTGIAYTFK